MCFQELILHVADTSVAKRIFIRVTGYHDLYKRSRNPDTELLSQIIEEAAEQRKEEEKTELVSQCRLHNQEQK